MTITAQKIRLSGWLFIFLPALLLGIASESSLSENTNPAAYVYKTNAVYITPSVLSAQDDKEINRTQAADTKVRVVVAFKAADSLSSALRADAISTTPASVRKALPTELYKVISDVKHIPAVSMEIYRAELDALRANPAVAAINEDRKVFPTMNEANVLTGVGSILHRFITIKYSSVINVPLYT